MTDVVVASGTPVIVDQSIEDLNSKLSQVVDKSLGFGFLEGEVKGQLIKLRNPVPFCTDVSTDLSFYFIDSTSSYKDIARLKNIVQLTTPKGDNGAEGNYSSGSQASQDQRAVCFFFKRVIAKRCIPVPKFSGLIPVRKSAHAEDGRWIVERFGNQLCTDEFYGGVANISFIWSHSSGMTTSQLIASVQAALASGGVKKELIRMSLTSTIGVMNLIESLNHLPIDCAVPVGTSTVPIQNTRGFPHTVNVETQIRDLKMQEKLTTLLQRIHDNGGKDSALYELVDRLGEMIEDAAINDRALLPNLKELANSVQQTLVHHGKCVELYERYGEYRLHTDDCTTTGVTAAATETLFGVTLGVAIPIVRRYQWGLFEKSKKWTTPEHYKGVEITHTLSLSGYYDRVKLQLLFDNEELVRSWRGQMENILAKRTSPLFWKSLFHAFAA